jgi:release factor glutamine methyltransferase
MSRLLAKSGVESHHLDAQLIVAHALGIDRLDIYRNPDLPVNTRQQAAVRSRISRRASGIPTAYITGTKEFWSLPISVDERVLIPRPETELLVEEALAAARTLPPEVKILEIGTGSGAVSLALGVELVNARIVSTDVSDDALKVAAANISAHGLTDRVGLKQGDLFAALEPDERFALIVSNPPYLTDEEMEGLTTEVRAEPRGALWGGRDGLSVIERLIRGAPDRVEAGGFLIFEMGSGQQQAVGRLIDETDGLVFSHMRNDYAGHPRVVAARRIDR